MRLAFVARFAQATTAVEVSDTTGGDSSYAAGYIKIPK
jgi:hypothetical protein